MIVHTFQYFARGENMIFSTQHTHQLLQHYDQFILCLVRQGRQQKPCPPIQTEQAAFTPTHSKPLGAIPPAGTHSWCSLCQQSSAQQPALQSAGSVCLLLRAQLSALRPPLPRSLAQLSNPNWGKLDHIQLHSLQNRTSACWINAQEHRSSLHWAQQWLFLCFSSVVVLLRTYSKAWI